VGNFPNLPPMPIPNLPLKFKLPLGRSKEVKEIRAFKEFLEPFLIRIFQLINPFKVLRNS